VFKRFLKTGKDGAELMLACNSFHKQGVD